MNDIKIKYVGFYDLNLYAQENRNSFLSATNKMDYIAEVFSQIGLDVEIVSPSWTKHNSGYYPGRKTQISDKIYHTCGPTFGAKSRILRYFKKFFSWIWLIFYLLKNTTKNDVLVVYHSTAIIFPIMFFHKLRKNPLILEVEEIYQDVNEFPNYIKRKEYNFFKIADKYIFPTNLLNQKINTRNKPYTIIHGTYKVEDNKNLKFDDNKIHVVYAGTFDPRKGGALAAAAAAEFLPENYHVHIIGFGSRQQVLQLKEKIKRINKISKAKVTYDGLLKGEDYINFLQKCHIGLSTQIPEAKYNDTSFPSKILSYMANGLKVVTIRIKSIEESAIGNDVFYYNEQNPKSIAEVIKNINLNVPYDSRSIIADLNMKFEKDLRKLLVEKYD